MWLRSSNACRPCHLIRNTVRLPNSTDLLCLPVAKVPRCRHLRLFLLTTTTTCARVQGKILPLTSSPSVLANSLVEFKAQCYSHSKGLLFALKYTCAYARTSLQVHVLANGKGNSPDLSGHNSDKEREAGDATMIVCRVPKR